MKLVDEILLNGTWELRDEDLNGDLSGASRFSKIATGWIDTPVPGDIHQGLIAAGKIREPLEGLNSLDCRWTEDRSWWFRKVFEIKREWLAAEVVELELNGLDSNAEIFLNRTHIGSHRNAFRPFILDIKDRLRPGKNILLVRLTAGIESVSDSEMKASDGKLTGTERERGRPDRGEPRRIFVRKPQYSFGWDWCPRVATTAISGDVKIRALTKACVRQVNLRSIQCGDATVMVSAVVTVERFHYYKTIEGEVSVSLSDNHGRKFSSKRKLLLRSGYNFIELNIPITEPQLWWPNGLGEQHLYRVESSLKVDDEYLYYPIFEYGLRFVELAATGCFAVVINGRKVFCKGANWVPVDAIYTRSSDKRYQTLIRESKNANFNTLRVWGGGLYERDAFYRACDRYGIMVWHDFMFANAPYPDNFDWFRREVELETDYQTKRLQHHPCIVLWCGCNENIWGFKDWWGERTRRGAWIYNCLLPGIVKCNDPDSIYWNSSPYGGDSPNSSEAGNRHHWDCMMNPDAEKRIIPEEYDKCTSLFVSEFGYIGACCRETARNYTGDASPDRRSPVWKHHTNTFEENIVEAGIRRHYADPETLTLDNYLLYSGLCQGLMLGYSIDSLRFRADCHGSLFWMYNDCWGELGWSIIDYYLRRKPSWYFVRRACAPLRLILRSEGDSIRVIIANDTPDSFSREIEYGYISLDGTPVDLNSGRVIVRALERTEICRFQRGGHNPTEGLWIARTPGNPEIAPAVFRAVDYRQLKTGIPGLSSSTVVSGEKSCVIRIGARSYAHSVFFELPSEVLPSDNYFDLLPGETRDISLESTEPLKTAMINLTCVNSSGKKTIVIP